MSTATLRVGDVVRVTRTAEVVDVDHYGAVKIKDEKSGWTLALYDTDRPSSLKVEVVRKAKPQVGDVITGREVLKHMWKRGTTFKLADFEAVLVLDKDGKLHSSYSGNVWPIESIDPGSKFKILHIG